MTVKELIAKLVHMPQDLDVEYLNLGAHPNSSFLVEEIDVRTKTERDGTTTKIVKLS